MQTKKNSLFKKLMNSGIMIYFLFLAVFASAETVWNPPSNHQQFLSYGLFFDPQSMIILKSGRRSWGAVGGSVAILEVNDQKWKPQYVLHVSANSSFRFPPEQDGVLHTETIDARLGAAVDLKFSESFRGTIIWTHQSGHISDNVTDPDLIGPDLSNELVDFRWIKDVNKNWRFGGGFRPLILSSPKMSFFGGHQFVEWFPYGVYRSHWSPFAAAGLEEYGVTKVDLTLHVQMGWVVGDHFSAGPTQAMRFVLGAYNGQDARLKYVSFKKKKDDFVYAGLFFDF
ncbi:MAG: hypothetical protein K1X29_06015 [Bdellovibrionales bacterium]|nr:hypothetical protein [Bdellovibrionales bacterium]